MHRRVSAGIGSARVTHLLSALGLPQKEIYPRFHQRHNKYRASFWSREEHRLLEWLERAHHAYREQIKRVHPDLGGSKELACGLNQCWQRVRMLFARHGITLG